MSDAVEAVVRGEESKGKFERKLRGRAHCSHRGDHCCCIKVPAEQGRDKVAESKNVEASRQHRAGDAVQRGADPGDLRLVDGEMRSDGSAETLLDELLRCTAANGLGLGALTA